MTAIARNMKRRDGSLEDVGAVFADHELLAFLGRQSALNVLMWWRGRPLSSLNLLHEARLYSANDPALRPFAPLASPALLAPL